MTALGSIQEGLEGLASAGIVLPEGAAQQLATYLELLEKWNQVYNLTAIRDVNRMVTHHVLDSLAVLPHIERAPVERLLDVGSGAGIPGIPLAIARPAWRVTLLDSNHKKAAFMQQALAAVAASNAEVCATRLERFAPETRFDVIISRAFSDLGSFAESARRLLAPAGRIVAMKGVFPHEELEQVPAGLRVVATEAVKVPGMDAQRHLVILEAA
ncbi:MAG: 16S rRNA (guanine(527)-N(7))-methyltransferase RsmG [Pseudomonadota bacterium]|nr:16S rRNA (guanine(527)-N(7))-methyltransferase RsmG [Pseudomonadota bacterium]